MSACVNLDFGFNRVFRHFAEYNGTLPSKMYGFDVILFPLLFSAIRVRLKNFNFKYVTFEVYLCHEFLVFMNTVGCVI